MFRHGCDDKMDENLLETGSKSLYNPLAIEKTIFEAQQ
jgi:hypothetical protein